MKKLFFGLVLALGLSAMTVTASAGQMVDILNKCAASGASEADVSQLGLTKAQADEEFTYFMSVSDKSWAVDKTVKYAVSGDKVAKVMLTYKYDKSTQAAKQAMINKAENDIAEQAKKYTSDYEKAKFVYDYLIDNYDYDLNMNSKTVVDLYESKVGVCRSYAIAYKDILTRLGIQCDVVVSIPMCHEWNVVKIDGGWYYADVSGADLLGSDRESFFLKSQTFFNIFGYNGGKIMNNAQVVKDKNYGE